MTRSNCKACLRRPCVLADGNQVSCQRPTFGLLCMQLLCVSPFALCCFPAVTANLLPLAGEASPQWDHVQKLSSPDWQAPLWVAATCLRMMAEQYDGDWPVAPDEMQLLTGFFATAAAAIPEGHSGLLDLALQVSARHC